MCRSLNSNGVINVWNYTFWCVAFMEKIREKEEKNITILFVLEKIWGELVFIVLYCGNLM